MGRLPRTIAVVALLGTIAHCSGEGTGPAAKTPAALVVTPDSISLHVGQTLQMHLVALDSAGDTLAVDSARWTSSDTSVLTVSGTGVVTGRAAGIASVAALVGNVSDSASLRVLIPVSRVSLSPPQVMLVPGGSLKLTASIQATDGSTLSDRDVSWMHQTNAITIDAATGLVRATAAGRDSVTAVSEGIASSNFSLVTVTQPRFVKIVSNGLADHTCALTASAATYCWGANEAAELGVGTYGDSLGRGAFWQYPFGGLWTPTGLPLPNPAVVAVGQSMTCAVSSGVLFCWGFNDEGSFGTNAFQSMPIPFHIVLPVLATSAVVGEEWACALGSDSIPYCWGGSVTGFLTQPTASSTLPYTSIFSGYKTLCGITADSLAYCGFPRPSGQTLVWPTLKFLQLTIGRDHQCGVAVDSTAYCWGSNSAGQLGDSTTTPHATPAPVSGGLKFAALAAGLDFTCGIRADTRAVYCWGQMGAQAFGTVPAPVSGGLSFTQITTGLAHACGIAIDGNVYCWGHNQSGQLGDGTTIDRAAPVLVLGQQP